MTKIRLRLKIAGFVQGVGFRPFVYRLARGCSLTGWVRNTESGVEIEVEGQNRKVNEFPYLLKKELPPLAEINQMTTCRTAVKGDSTFKIKLSSNTGITTAVMLPDAAVCSDCLQEMKNPENRRYRYPFISCTNCGPRYSIIKDLPYDRFRTTMKDFEMCDKCRGEYEDPLSRRYHAQTTACFDCGPRIWLTDENGRELKVDDPVKKAVKLLEEGNLLAVKGIGGFHLMCNVEDENAVAELRRRKMRPDKPLALMMKNIALVSRNCCFSKKEKKILTGWRRPILLLDKKKSSLPENIASGSRYYGVMLPYTSLHHLLFDKCLSVLVVTSANISGSPIIYRNKTALKKLSNTADFFLLHDREIHLPVDDSVVRVIMGKERVIRPGRGYVPYSVETGGFEEGLALGAEQKSTIAVNKNQTAFISQYLGNISNKDAFVNFKFVLDHYRKLYQIKPVFIAHDLHPDYQSSYYSYLLVEDFNSGEVEHEIQTGVQHHYAHLVSCLVENNVSDQVIGLIFDGSGLGDDGSIWGGEFLLGNLKSYMRVGHLDYMKMPGGEKAVKEPWRMAVSFLYKLNYDLDAAVELLEIEKSQLKIVLNILENDLNCPLTSSMGRLFAAAAALTGIRKEISYQAQAAVELETAAANIGGNIAASYCYQIEKHHGMFVVITAPLIKDLISDYQQGEDPSMIAIKFHNTIVNFSCEICRLIRDDYGVNAVVLSGGVFQNKILLKGIFERLNSDNFTVYTHGRIPCNDASISLGQLAAAGSRRGGKN